MGVPKRKTTKSRKGHRRGHHKLKARKYVICPHCGAPMLSHHVCPKCGYYKGKKKV